MRPAATHGAHGMAVSRVPKFEAMELYPLGLWNVVKPINICAVLVWSLCQIVSLCDCVSCRLGVCKGNSKIWAPEAPPLRLGASVIPKHASSLLCY